MMLHIWYLQLVVPVLIPLNDGQVSPLMFLKPGPVCKLSLTIRKWAGEVAAPLVVQTNTLVSEDDITANTSVRAFMKKLFVVSQVSVVFKSFAAVFTHIFFGQF